MKTSPKVVPCDPRQEPIINLSQLLPESPVNRVYSTFGSVIQVRPVELPEHKTMQEIVEDTQQRDANKKDVAFELAEQVMMNDEEARDGQATIGGGFVSIHDTTNYDPLSPDDGDVLKGDPALLPCSADVEALCSFPSLATSEQDLGAKDPDQEDMQLLGNQFNVSQMTPPGGDQFQEELMLDDFVRMFSDKNGLESPVTCSNSPKTADDPNPEQHELPFMDHSECIDIVIPPSTQQASAEQEGSSLKGQQQQQQILGGSTETEEDTHAGSATDRGSPPLCAQLTNQLTLRDRTVAVGASCLENVINSMEEPESSLQPLVNNADNGAESALCTVSRQVSFGKYHTEKIREGLEENVNLVAREGLTSQKATPEVQSAGSLSPLKRVGPWHHQAALSGPVEEKNRPLEKKAMKVRWVWCITCALRLLNVSQC